MFRTRGIREREKYRRSSRGELRNLHVQLTKVLQGLVKVEKGTPARVRVSRDTNIRFSVSMPQNSQTNKWDGPGRAREWVWNKLAGRRVGEFALFLGSNVTIRIYTIVEIERALRGTSHRSASAFSCNRTTEDSLHRVAPRSTVLVLVHSSAQLPKHPKRIANLIFCITL